jgi:hypothetical protein
VGAVLSLRIGTVFIVFSDLSWERRRTSVEADRKCKRPFGGNALPTALAAPPARRGRAVRQHGVARRDFGWGCTCVSGTGRVVPQGCPGEKTSGRRGSTLPAGSPLHRCMGADRAATPVASPVLGAGPGAPPGSRALRRERLPRAWHARAQPRGGVSAGGWRCGALEGALLSCQAEMLKFSPPSRMPFKIPIRMIMPKLEL